MARQQSNRVVVEKEPSGCGIAFAVLFLVGLAVAYWYITLSILGLLVTIAVARAARDRKRPKPVRSKPGPRDPWLNEVGIALADLGLTEFARNTGELLGGVPIDGDIGVEAKDFRVYVTLFSDQPSARNAERGLRAKPPVRSAIANGTTAILATGRVVFVAHRRGGVVDEFRLDEVVRVAGRIPLPPALRAAAPIPRGAAPATPAPAGPARGRAADPDALEQLRRLGELRAAGIVSAPEFEAKKAELLARV